VIPPDVTPEEAAAIASISRLAAYYSEAICRGAIEEAVLVYAPDGVLSSGTTDDAVGHAAIATTIREAVESFELVYNTTLPGMIFVEGDEARARFPVTELAKRPDGTTLHFLGYYEDRLRRGPEGWRFTHRTLHGITLGRSDTFSRSRTHPLGPAQWGLDERRAD
jgi:hypothetical protein